MKKSFKSIISIILSVALLCGAGISTVAFAQDDELVILSPTDGMACTSASLQCTVSAPDSVAEVNISIDGVPVDDVIACSDGVFTADVDTASLSLGVHTLTASADGLDSKSVQFGIYSAKKATGICTFEGMTTDSTPSLSGWMFIRQGKSMVVTSDGRGGSTTNVVKITDATKNTTTNSMPDIRPPVGSGYDVLTVEADVKVSDSGVRLLYEFPLNKAPWASYFNAVRSSTKNSASAFELSPDNWYHIKTVFDLNEGTYVNTMQPDGGTAETRTGSFSVSGIKGEIRLCFASELADGGWIMYDNMSYTTDKNFAQQKSTAYVQEGTEVVCSDGRINAGAESVKVYFTDSLSSVGTSNVSFFADGDKLELSDVSFNTADNSLIASFGELLPPDCTAEFIIGGSAKYSDGSTSLGKNWVIPFTIGPVSEAGSGRFRILHPANGGEYETDSVECRVSAGAFNKMIFLLDEKEISCISEQNASGVYTYTLTKDMLSYGSHKLEVYLLDSDGSLISRDTSFFVYLSKSTSSVINFNNLSTSSSFSNSTVPEVDMVIKQNGYYAITAGGKDGTPALEITDNMERDSLDNNNSAPYFQINYESSTAILKVEADIKIAETGDRFMWEFPSGYFYAPYKTGSVSYGSAITPGVWHHIQVAFDFENKTISGTVQSESGGEAGVISRSGMTLGGKNNQYWVRFGYAGASKGNSMLLDNLSFTEERRYASITSAAYVSGGTETVINAEGAAPGAEAIKLYFSGGFNADSINSDTVSLLVDGKELSLKYAQFSSDDNSVTAVLSQPLASGNGGKIIISPDAKFDDGNPIGRSYEYSFAIKKEKIAVTDVTLKKGSVEIKSFAQLLEGDKISAEVTLSNPAESERTVLVILSFYNKDGSFAGLCSSNATVGAGESARVVTIDNPSVGYSDAMAVKVHLCDGWANRVPLDSWEVD